MIGSKSPLAYTESYEVITIAEGMLYHYEIVRQAPAPTATLLTSYKTQKKSGTTVRVEVKQEDKYKLHNACKRQLVYFDNVIVTNELIYYDNHFKIIEHPLFVVRSDEYYPFQKEMHIVVGQVAYPIDWAFLGLKPIKVPVGIKFEIKEITVDLSRESIRYVEDLENGIDIKTLVLDRIKEVKKVLKELYIEKSNIQSLAEYIHVIQNPKTVIELGGYDIYFGLDIKNSEHTFNYKGYSYSFHKDDVDLLSMAFEGLNISNKKANWHTPLYGNIFNYIYNYRYSKKGELSHWNSLYHNNHTIIRRKKITKNIIYKYAKMLGLVKHIIRFDKFKEILETGSVKKVLNFIKAVEESFTTYIPDYDYVPQTFINEEKAKQEALKEERKGNITYYNPSGNKTVVTLKSLIEDYNYVFYLSRDASNEEQMAYYQLYQSFRPSIKKRILFVIISNTTITKLKNKTKDLTLTKVTGNNSRKKKVVETKLVYAFLSADKMFNYTELYTDFHNLRYTTNLISCGYTTFNLRGISNYYYDLIQTMPRECDFYLNTNNGRLYPYMYFKSRIDSIVKHRNYHKEKNFEELMKVGRLLFMFHSAETLPDGILIRQNIIKTYKLTKLNSFHYGKF